MFLPFSCLGQDISGTWEGNMGESISMVHPEKIVLKLTAQNDSLLSGSSHLYYTNNHYEHYKVKGTYNSKNSTVYITELAVIGLKIGIGVNCLGNYKMYLSVNDTTMRLDGKWRDNKNRFILTCPTTEVWFEKSISHKPAIDTIRDKKLTSRLTDIQHIIEIDENEKDSIKIEVFDNAEVDNDIVSVYFDDKPLLIKQKISSVPITKYISLSSGNPVSQIIVVAESLGNIPPCTAQLIITTKINNYLLNISSDYTKNSSIELFLKK